MVGDLLKAQRLIRTILSLTDYSASADFIASLVAFITCAAFKISVMESIRCSGEMPSSGTGASMLITSSVGLDSPHVLIKLR